MLSIRDPLMDYIQSKAGHLTDVNIRHVIAYEAH